MNLQEAGIVEAVVIGLCLIIDQCAQGDREYYHKRVQEQLANLQNSIPEHCRLIAKAALEEIGIAEDEVSQNIAVSVRVRFMQFSFREGLKKLGPYIISFFV